MTALEDQFPAQVIIGPHELRDRWSDERPRRVLLRRWLLWLWLAEQPVLWGLSAASLAWSGWLTLDAAVMAAVFVALASGLATVHQAPPAVLHERADRIAGDELVSELSTTVMAARCLVDDTEAGAALRRVLHVSEPEFEVVQTLIDDGFDGSAQELLEVSRAALS